MSKGKYIVNWNMPGYLPENTDPGLFDTLAEAKRDVRENILFHRDSDSYRYDENPPAIEVWTPLHKITAADIKAYGDVEYASYGDYVYWIGWTTDES